MAVGSGDPAVRCPMPRERGWAVQILRSQCLTAAGSGSCNSFRVCTRARVRVCAHDRRDLDTRLGVCTCDRCTAIPIPKSVSIHLPKLGDQHSPSLHLNRAISPACGRGLVLPRAMQCPMRCTA